MEITEFKSCRKCGDIKPISDYSKWPNRNSHRPDCKPCVAAKQRSYLNSNPKAKERTRELSNQRYWQKRNQELPELLEKLQTTRFCTSCGYEGPINEFVSSKAKVGAITKTRLRGTCIPCHEKRTKDWIARNPDKIKVYYKKTYARRKQDVEYVKNKKEYDRIKYKTDEDFRENKRIKDRENRRTSQSAIWRRLLRNTISQLKTTKTDKTQKLLGYSATELFKYLGNKSNPTDHIDHNIPLSWLIPATPPNLACNLNNLSWLSENENLAKNNKYANPVTLDYYNQLKHFIKDEFQNRFIQQANMMIDCKKDFIIERWSKNLSCVE
jgi:hypothetical protein